MMRIPRWWQRVGLWNIDGDASPTTVWKVTVGTTMGGSATSSNGTVRRGHDARMRRRWGRKKWVTWRAPGGVEEHL
jgi:hypothetical protein